MNIQAITSNYVNSYNKTAHDKRAKVAFQGISPELLKATPDEFISGARKTLGFSTEKLRDSFRKLIDALKDLSKENKTLKEGLYDAQDQILAFPEQKRIAVQKAEENLRNSYQQIIENKNQELNAARQEVKIAKEFAAKYEPMAKVKSVEELDIVMPKQVIETLDKMVEQKIPARKSMWEFLTTGKGQEEALAQIERNNILLKAKKDEILNIPEISKKLQETEEAGIRYMSPPDCALNMMYHSLTGAPNGDIIMSGAIREQIRKNAMAILAPLADEKGYFTLETIEAELAKKLESAADFRKRLSKGLEKARTSNEYKIKEYPVDFDTKASKIIREFSNGYSDEVTFSNAAFGA